MLRPLRVALGEWAPRVGAPPDPLSAIAAAWPALAGPGIAEHARPVEIVRDTLVVVTRSSSWSQQLAFLSPEILAGLRALPEAGAIARLRFRVGNLRPARARGAASPVAARRRRTDAPEPLGPDAGPAEALRRFRERVARRRRAPQTMCAGCGAHRPGGGLCAPCAGDAGSARMAAVQRLMYEAPWLGYADVAQLIGGVEPAEYERWRRALLARWWEILVRARWAGRVSSIERRVASSYVLLQSGLDPDRISPAIVRNLLGDDLAAQLFERHG